MPDVYVAEQEIYRFAYDALTQSGVREDVAGLRRVDAGEKSYICTHGHPFATDRRHTQPMFNRKFTREAKIHPSMSGGCLSGDSILH